MFTPDEAQSLFMAHGVTWDYQARGVVLFSVPDCSRPGAGLASGVQVTLEGGMSDPAVRRWYGRTSFDFNATETSDGAGGFVNVLPGAVTVAATPVAIGRPSSKVPIWVRADTVTVVFLVPTP
jgi:hypothetical protein